MRIAEIFHSIQGEGQFAGTPTVFVRTTGCNLRCWFCDTAYTSWKPEGSQIPWETVLKQVREFDCEHVVVTGGEPLLQPDVAPLTQALRFSKNFVTIETAGTVYRSVHADLMSISPKRANSTPDRLEHLPSDVDAGSVSSASLQHWSARHEQLRDNREVIERLIDDYVYQFKFVIDQPEDLDDVRKYVSELENVPPESVWLMAQAITAEQLQEKAIWLMDAAEEHGYHYSPRMHIELFGNVRGK